MPNADNLLTLAEISVALAALSGLVAVFLSRGELNLLDKFRFSLIIAVACTNTLCAFVPLWVERWVRDEESIWRIASIICVVVAVTFGAAILYRLPSIYPLVPSDVSLGRRLLEPLVFGLGGTILVLNTVGWPLPPNATAHELFLVLGLFAMALLFASIVLIRPIDPEDN